MVTDLQSVPLEIITSPKVFKVPSSGNSERGNSLNLDTSAGSRIIVDAASDELQEGICYCLQ